MDNEQNPTLAGLPEPQDLIAAWLDNIDTLDLFATDVRPEWRQEVIEMRRTNAEQEASEDVDPKSNRNVEILIGDADGLMFIFIPMDGSRLTASFRYRPMGLKYQYVDVDASVCASAMELMERFPLKCFPKLKNFDRRVSYSYIAEIAFRLMAGEPDKALAAYQKHIILNGCIRTLNDLPLNFMFDTGASSVWLSQVEANYMLRNDYPKCSDFFGHVRFVDVNGNIIE